MVLGGALEAALVNGIHPLKGAGAGSSLAFCERRDNSGLCDPTEGPHQTPGMLEPLFPIPTL